MQKNGINGTEVSLELSKNHHKDRKVDTTSKIDDGSPPLWLSKRLLVAFVLFLCFVNFQILRNNINITIVEMTSNKSFTEGNLTITKKPDFNWDTTTVGLILSILAYGGLFSIFGDLSVNRFGGSVTCANCMLLSGIFTILHPAFLSLDFYLFLACRFVTGIFEMFFYVGTSDIFSRWFPKKERSMLISFSFNGTNIGVVGVYPLCGYLAHKWGWQMVFYVTGSISVITAVLCFILVKNQPSQDKLISEKELSYIVKETEHSSQMNIDHPYKSIFTSVPVWTLCMASFVFMWISSVVNSCLPLYVKDLSKKGTDEVGLISSIPNISYIFLFPIDGLFMDYWKNHSNITETKIHKIILSIAFIFASVMFLVSAIVSHLTTTLVSFVLIQMPMSFVPIIVETLLVNLAPDHSSIVSGMGSSSLSLSAIAGQTVTCFMTTNHTLQEWNNCFYLAAAISTFGAVLYLLGGSSEIQPWALPSPANNDEKDHKSEID